MVDIARRWFQRGSWICVGLAVFAPVRAPAAAGQLSTAFKPDNPAPFFAYAAAPDDTAYVLYSTGVKVAHLDGHGHTLGDFTAHISSDSIVSNVARDASGTLFLTGIIKPDGSSSYQNVVKLKADGSPDPSLPSVNVWYSAADNGWDGQQISAIAPDGHGGCWIGGSFDSVNGVAAHGFAHVSVPGGVTVEPNPSTSAAVTFLARAADGVIIGAGNAFYKRLDTGGLQPFDFTPPGGGRVLAATFDDRFGLAVATTTSTVIRCFLYGSDGKASAAFSPAVGFVNGPSSLAWDARGRLLVCSSQLADYQVGPVPPGYGVKRLQADGSLDPSWNQSAIYTGGLQFALPTADAVIVSGAFTAIDGISVGHVVKLSADDTMSRSSNQSVLGWVDGGQRRLILGFTIRGEFTGEALIRACGPSLAQFGVAELPTQTAFTVYRGQQVVYRALPGVQTSGPGHPYDRSQAAVWATAVTGAFPLANNGFNEAEALLQLVPGAYTVVIDIPTGQTGQVLGEIYFP